MNVGLENIPDNSRPSTIACRVCGCPYILPNSRTCAQCGATGKQRSGSKREMAPAWSGSVAVSK